MSASALPSRCWPGVPVPGLPVLHWQTRGKALRRDAAPSHGGERSGVPAHATLLAFNLKLAESAVVAFKSESELWLAREAPRLRLSPVTCHQTVQSIVYSDRGFLYLISGCTVRVACTVSSSARP
eukprot:967318-Rhodomonas_salina.2